jgi:hypothetical protein
MLWRGASESQTHERLLVAHNRTGSVIEQVLAFTVQAQDRLVVKCPRFGGQALTCLVGQ